MPYVSRLLSQVVVASFLAVGCFTAFAQNESENDDALVEEIIVTATKREVNLQDSSLAITAFTGDQLADRGFRNLMDVASAIPGVDVAEGAPGRGVLIFRGLSVINGGIGRGAVNHQQTNISYLDDIVLFPGITPVKLVDVERLEVIKGPQGTLFGKSAMAGVARYISNDPDTSAFDAEATVSLESVASGDQGNALEGYVNIPISDRAALRVVGYRYEMPGFVDVVGPFKQSDANTEDTSGVRLRGTWQTTDAITLDFTWLQQETDIGDSGEPTPTWVPSSEADPHQIALTRFDADDPKRMWQHPGYTEENVASLTITWELDAVTLLAIGADMDSYTKFHNEMSDSCGHGDYPWCWGTIIGGLTPNGLPFAFNDTSGPNYRNIETFELRAVSNSEPGDKFEWIAGFWLENNNHQRSSHWFWTTDDRAYLESQQAIALAAAPLDANGLPWLANADSMWTMGCKIGQRGESVDIASGQYFHERFTRNNSDEKSLFGELGINVTDQVKLTGGYRLSRLRTNFAKNNGRHGPCWYDMHESEGERTSNWQNVGTYRLNLDYHVNDDLMLFAFAASGYRPSGSNFYQGKASSERLPGEDTPQGPWLYALKDFDSDSVWNYEAGARSVLQDGRLVLNGSIFRIDWADMQSTLDNPADLAADLGWGYVYTSGRYLGNIGEARVTGFEGMAIWAVNSALDLTLNFAYKKSEIIEDKRPHLVGKALAGSSSGDIQFSVFADWTKNLSDDLDLRVNATFRHVPERTSGYSDLLLQNPVPSYQTMDASVGLARGDWEIALNIQNLFDERGYTAQPIGRGDWPNPNGDAHWLDRFNSFDVIRPRTVGLAFTYSFGN